MRSFLSNNSIRILLGISSLVSICAFLYFASSHLNLAYGDAVSRLNISRKLIDNITPGLGQLGNVWLPLPHVLMAPFTWNQYLWHSGIAGWIISGISFIVLILYLYRIGVDIFKSKLSGVVMVSVALTNINVLYLQTTAMTEIFFITTVIVSIYYLMKWSKYDNLLDLIHGALWVSAASLIRYEGYFVAAFACLLVIIVSYLKYGNKKTTEGTTIKFATLAFTGIVLWMVYLGVVFGNPLIWMDIYSGKAAVISTEEPRYVEGPSVTPKQQSVFFHSAMYYASSMHMNGFIVTIWGTVLFLAFLVFLMTKSRFKDSSYYLFLLIPLAVFAFIVMSFYRGLPLIQPSITLENIINPGLNYKDDEYNIRYGMNALPFICLMIGWATSQKKSLAYISAVFISVQFAATFVPGYFLIYQLPTKFTVESNAVHPYDQSLNWFKQHYTGGTIMISAYKHDPVMFFLGLPYKTYIHEGTQKYWLESRQNPQKYATWIYMYKPTVDSRGDEPVTKWIGNNPNLAAYYDLLYEDDTYVIYKIKTKPEILLDI
jgi:hypothetical protein